MKLVCPSCRESLGAADINVAADVALCPHCDEVFAVSGVVAPGGGVVVFDIDDPPPGVSYEQTPVRWRLRASTRSWAGLFLVPFVCVFGLSIHDIFSSATIGLGTIVMGAFVGLCTLLFALHAIMGLLGQIVVSRSGVEGEVFMGVGTFGWKRRFDWASVTSVQDASPTYLNSGKGFAIALVGQRRITFGRMLNEDRRHYVLHALRKLLHTRSS